MMNLIQRLFRAALGIVYHPLLWLHQLSENQAAKALELLESNSVQGKTSRTNKKKTTKPTE